MVMGGGEVAAASSGFPKRHREHERGSLAEQRESSFSGRRGLSAGLETCRKLALPTWVLGGGQAASEELPQQGLIGSGQPFVGTRASRGPDPLSLPDKLQIQTCVVKPLEFSNVGNEFQCRHKINRRTLQAHKTDLQEGEANLGLCARNMDLRACREEGRAVVLSVDSACLTNWTAGSCQQLLWWRMVLGTFYVSR